MTLNPIGILIGIRIQLLGILIRDPRHHIKVAIEVIRCDDPVSFEITATRSTVAFVNGGQDFRRIDKPDNPELRPLKHLAAGLIRSLHKLNRVA